MRRIRLLVKFRHPHLLPLLGYFLMSRPDNSSMSLAAATAGPPPPCLVYPLMLGGNFEDRLHPTDAKSWERLQRLGFGTPPARLSWSRRLRILCDTTSAVLHLHAHSAVVRATRELKYACFEVRAWTHSSTLPAVRVSRRATAPRH